MLPEGTPVRDPVRTGESELLGAEWRFEASVDGRANVAEVRDDARSGASVPGGLRDGRRSASTSSASNHPG